MIAIETALLAGLMIENEDSYRELEELAKTAFVKIVGRIIQNKDVPHPAFFIGPGKAYEIKDRCKLENIDAVIFNHNLKPNQQRNLENVINRKIVDRCTLILDIFAKHAKTNEGKLQVELAQLIYLLPRLSGRGAELSQLGGGIGTRGPGEKKLEVDRRRIRQKITFLKEKIEGIRKHRNNLRQSRESKGFLTATMVGYTNSGKSTLLNKLTHSNVLVENKLFSTLDPTTRKLFLPNGKELLLTDTVGFIRNLPAELITSFRATLEEIKYADIIVVVVDISRKDIDIQQDAVYRELKELEVLNKPIITILNKIDLIEPVQIKRLSNNIPDSVAISALKGQNIQNFLSKISLISKELLTKT